VNIINQVFTGLPEFFEGTATMFLRYLAVNGLLVFLDFRDNILITIADAVFAETPEPVLFVAVRFGEARISDETIPLSQIERKSLS
jgi:hypothetical protein